MRNQGARLIQRGNIYAVEFYNPATQNTGRSSLGTTDAEEAARLFAEWQLERHWASADEERRKAEKVILLANRILQGKPTDSLEDASVVEILARFYSEIAQNYPSKYTYKAALAHATTYLGGDTESGVSAVSMSEFDERRQEAFVQALRDEEGLADGTIARIMAAIATACKRAYRAAGKTRPYIMYIPSSVQRQRILTDEECKQIVDSAVTENAKRFVALAFLTAARPQAIIDLEKSQFDLKRKLLDLNPQGRKQNPKKYRPTIPTCNSLLELAETWDDGPIFTVVRKDHKIKLATSRSIVESLNFPEGATAYTIRHTVATELRTRGVPELDISGFLGHRMPGMSQTTLGYAKYRPEYLGRVRDCVDTLWGRINASRTTEDRSRDVGSPGEGREGGGRQN